MKKLILNMLLLFGITVTLAAQAYDPVPMAVTPSTQPENNTLLYNPQYGYATEMYRSYWVWDKASFTWVKRVELVAPAPLPPVTNSYAPYTIPYNGTDVGKANTGAVKNKTKPGGQ
jgi:hypothetical protein